MQPLTSCDLPAASVSLIDTGGVVIARQPIMDAQYKVVAYELFDRSTVFHNAASDVALVFNAMTHIGNEPLVGKMAIFVNCTHESLSGGHLDLIQPDKVVLEVGPVPGHSPANIAARQHTLQELRTRGFRLAFTHTVLAPVYAAWQPLADFVKLDLMALKSEQLQAIVAAVKTRTSAAVVAEKVETAAQFAALLSYGATLFQGYWFARPDVIKTKVISPGQAHVLQLINLVRNQASTDEIENLLKKDALLGFNLMRLINSAGFGVDHKVTSFRQAVMLMGLKKLFRWAALLLTASNNNGALAAVGTTAVVRGRMMELLATGTRTPEECEGAFLVGIFSLLDVMLGMPMGRALALISLPPEVAEALEHGTGIYGSMFSLTKACESNDDTAFCTAANTLHFSNRHINTAHMEALVWADNLEI